MKLIHLSAIGADIESDIPYPRTKALGEKAIHDLLGKVDETGLPSGFIIRPGLILGRDDQFLNVSASVVSRLDAHVWLALSSVDQVPACISALWRWPKSLSYDDLVALKIILTCS